MENEIEILIVEDEALIAQNIKMQLEDFGYNISGVCYNYAAAEKAIADKTFDVLISDINLGNGTDEKSGLQLAEQLQKIKSCPVIFLTAFSDKDTIKKASLLRPSAYLIKPINAANLYAAVQVAVENFSKQLVASEEKQTEDLDYFFVKQGNNLVKIFWKEVYHLESLKNYVKITTTQITTGVLLRGSLQQVLTNMMPRGLQAAFVKINRSEAIVKSCINVVKEGSVETSYGEFKTSGDIHIFK